MFDLKESLAKVDSATKIEEIKEIFASASPFITEIIKKSEELVAQREADAKRLEEIEAQRLAAIAAQESLKQQLAEIQAVLAEVKAATAAAEEDRRFNERMDAVASTFDLTDDERALLIDEIKSLSDEAFAKWLDKSKLLMREKTFAFKTEKAAALAAKKAKKGKSKCGEDKSAPEGEPDGDEEDEDEEENDEAKAAIKQALASAGANSEKPTFSNEVSGTINADRLAQLKEAFKSGVTVGGKTLKQIEEDNKK
jgi:hypothetical protein